MKKPNIILSIAAAAVFAAYPAVAHEGHEHGDKEDLAAGETKKITGEVVDMACYIDHKQPARSTSIVRRSAS